ncbi:MAG: succinate dehydrogenase / fumarate reductase cytochrome b subunit [Myxococcota bacterium]|jgi:succinate dehydrogenase / fumarate reductase cytochrome b subunit
MTWALNFYRSNIGMKVVMAITGVVLFGFVIGHMVGNLQIFWGEHILDSYAAFLHEHPTILWPVRGGLLAALLAHMHAAITLTGRSRAARPQGYKKIRTTNYATIAMRASSVFVFGFIVYHLLHLTFGVVHPDFVHGEVYHNVTTAFQKPVVAIVYMVANALLGLHLYHGLWSMFRTLGVSSSRYDALARSFAQVFSLLVVVGNVIMPLAVLVGLVK